MLITFKGRSVFDKLKKDLPYKFEMKDLGKTKKVLVMDFERDRKGHKISLMQNRYLKKVLQKFNINGDTKSVSTPLALYFELKATMSYTTVEEREY